MSESLAAKVHDPLWMLTRQWQLGELHGEDAGSPAFVESSVLLGSLRNWSAHGINAQPLLETGLLETTALAEGFDLNDLSIAVELGHVFEHALNESGQAGLIPAFRQAYPLAEEEAGVPEHDFEAKNFLRVVAGRVTHGSKLYLAALNAAPNLPLEPVVPPDDVNAVFAAIERLQSYAIDTFEAVESIDSPAWDPEHLEYRLQVTGYDPAGGKIQLSAYADDDARLEWFAFDVEERTPPSTTPSRLSRVRRNAIPANITFRGMPRSRWWAFEDSTLNMDAIQPEKRELAKLIILDFLFVHSNDWYVVPFRTPVGKLCTIESLVVSDIFGVRTLIERADRNSGPVGKRWTMFSHVDTKTRAIADWLFLPPTAGASVIAGESLEEVHFARDEMANMAWAIEHSVENRIGESKPRCNAVRPDSVQDTPQRADVLKYLIQTTVPDSWTPFLPMIISPGKPDIALQQGMLLQSASQPPATGPVTRILNPTRVPSGTYRLAEEELSRLGLRVDRRVYRARETDGSTRIWIARSKRVRTGEERSSLLFDLTKRQE